ncbi:adenylate/guanylate cyclase domain-containing protein [Mycolicibacter hiberniae]|uniref:Adenylate/guanylate cyclase domain-containing protein n=1 Tax=Mycolicibacter hiberniae TaxID=29314 RepID=A0A7I7WZ70_9MYCO|nr:adenylate/guanylate cyclase domain-containing protein [Mycolicibacter hiberniae]MCV7085832.1 adenylate/guanylate cyclase domain-containing protein [Mycolicibacter hiberniae]ORV73246.1 guanylate cyclase [Mycolicibacter hiberniae]BBZ22859.1 adenylate/guanylate cyclase domain-containing protein [Mycolicibacter hiberniae]
MDLERARGEADGLGEAAEIPAQQSPNPRPQFSLDEAAAWLNRTTNDIRIVDLVRRVRQVLPGDPEFGDPLSTAGEGGPESAARAAGRLIGDRSAASREVSLGALQVWQALTKRISRVPGDAEATLVFTDLVGFSAWSLQSGDDATLTLLRRVSRAIEPPVLDAGGRIVKRMGDGMMAVFRDPLVAVAAALVAQEALSEVEVNGHTPRMRVGIHTGRPQRLADDWLGVDVNIAARVMERAIKGGIVVSGPTLKRIEPAALAELGVVAKRARRQVLAAKTSGVPADLVMYRLKAVRQSPPDAD